MVAKCWQRGVFLHSIDHRGLLDGTEVLAMSCNFVLLDGIKVLATLCVALSTNSGGLLDGIKVLTAWLVVPWH